MRTVKEILMERDGMLEKDADDLIADFKEALDYVLEHESYYAGWTLSAKFSAEALVADYFGLEPDYLMEFI